MPIKSPFSFWSNRRPSFLLQHDNDCCRLARAWFQGMARSRNNAGSLQIAPTWILGRYEWGPTRWPLYWCEAVESKKLDCGAFAALAREAFTVTGSTVFPCQLIQQFNELNVIVWRSGWAKAGCPNDWAKGSLVYHEACAIAEKQNIRIWDPTDNQWIIPTPKGYGSMLAFKIVVQNIETHYQTFLYHGTKIPSNTWVNVKSPPSLP